MTSAVREAIEVMVAFAFLLAAVLTVDTAPAVSVACAISALIVCVAALRRRA